MKDSALLTLIIFTPSIGALILCLPSRSESWMRSVGNFFTALTFALTLFAWGTRFDSSIPGMQMTSSTPWISAWHVNYSLGVDGISLPLVVLTGLISWLSILASGSVTRQLRGYL